MNHLTALAYGPGYFWFRVWGYGLRVMDRRQFPGFYAERTGMQKALRVGPYSIMGLKP